MLALFVPLGFWFWLGTRNPLALMPAVIALIGAPSFTRLLPSLGESLAALAGLVGGMLLARLVLSADRATYGRGSDQMRMVPISTTAPPVKRRDTRP
jgi:hypothetical protein